MAPTSNPDTTQINSDATTPEPARPGVDFIRARIQEDNASGRFGGQVHTRFPPEPNGYLHLGHAKSICLNFGVAREFGGLCNLRFDDTNPTKEETEYVESIREDVRWLGGDWQDREFYASNYFEQLYAYAEQLIRMGKAYVDDLTREEMREYRGSDAGKPSRPSPWRDRSPEENLDLFRRMRAGEFKEGEKTLRAKIDLASPNMNMRDPAIYRIKYAEHHRQGNKWCIYPMYDFAHPIQDAIEGITHSMCSLEFENHRPLYNWVIENIFGAEFPKQREFARLNMTNTVMSKRYLRELVEMGIVDGWDDPRMPTLCGLRRRGYTPTSIFTFVREAGDGAFLVCVQLQRRQQRIDSPGAIRLFNQTGAYAVICQRCDSLKYIHDSTFAFCPNSGIFWSLYFTTFCPAWQPICTKRTEFALTARFLCAPKQASLHSMQRKGEMVCLVI